MFRCLQVVVALSLLTWATGVLAADVYYNVPLEDLELTEGALSTQGNVNRSRARAARPPYAVLDGKGEVYVRFGTRQERTPPRTQDASPTTQTNVIVVRTTEARDIFGQIFLPSRDARSMVAARFKIPAKVANEKAWKTFYETKLAHYNDLLSRDVSGAAWFRHQARQAQKALGTKPGTISGTNPTARRRPRTEELADTFAMFSGGRAMSENLQLDRVLRPDQGGEENVALDSIRGITVEEINWKPLIEGLNPEFDPLAAKIPFDQHAIFFPTFNAAVAMSDEMADSGTPILQLAEPRSTSARTFERYQEQMCLTITTIARLVGPTVARSVAVTGSDPYFRTGTDMAVLFEAPDPKVLEELLMAQVRLRAAIDKDARPITGEIEGLTYRGLRSPDRSTCCYVAKMDGLVVVTNSPYQLRQLASVANGKTKSLASLDGYVFFRNRYVRNDQGETAFMFLSDATIRRWCGPRWRIGTSRRTRDAAVVAEIQASQLDRLVNKSVKTGPIYTDLPIAGDGELVLTPSGVHASTIGTLAFMTPISEMQIRKVTQAEAQAYRSWRTRYQQNWRWVFDPIGLRLGIHKNELAADLTVMPLIWGTDYRQLVSISQGVEFKPNEGDLHESLAHVILSVNTKSEMLQRQSNFARMMAGGIKIDPLSWLGTSVSVYVDDDPIWDEMAKFEQNNWEEIWRVPIGVRAEVSSGMKLTAFLAAVRGFIEQAAPGMTTWESLTYKEQPYVKITPTERAIGDTEEIQNLAVYYTASGKSLVITLNEDVLRRSMERELARAEAKKKGEDLPAPKRSWIGSNVALQVNQRILNVLAALGHSEYQTAMQTRAWANIEILNEWKRRYPNENPIELHQRFWQVQLVCPGGGEYVWNDKWQTMESTVYGCPGAPKKGLAAPPSLGLVKNGNFGLTFEEQGLRARVSLER